MTSARISNLPKSVVRLTTTLAVVLLTWLFVWPAGLGGNAGYVVVSGPSMEPTYETGDLVVAHRSDSYDVGDIVVYRTEYGNVIHRIVGGDAESGYVLRGDNNDAVDQWQPKDDDIVGKASLHIPEIGGIALLLKQVVLTPPMPYLIAGFVFLVFVLSDDKDKRKGDQEGRQTADGDSVDQLDAVPENRESAATPR